MVRLPVRLVGPAITALALVTATGAAAERLKVRIGAQSPYSECYCRANGQRYPVGEPACLRHGGGSRVAWCQMDQNVTSWRLTDSPCPES